MDVVLLHICLVFDSTLDCLVTEFDHVIDSNCSPASKLTDFFPDLMVGFGVFGLMTALGVAVVYVPG